jgi:hypothetical protein
VLDCRRVCGRYKGYSWRPGLHRLQPSGCCATLGCTVGRRNACMRLSGPTLRKPAAHHHAHKRWPAYRCCPALNQIRRSILIFESCIALAHARIRCLPCSMQESCFGDHIRCYSWGGRGGAVYVPNQGCGADAVPQPPCEVPGVEGIEYAGLDQIHQCGRVVCGCQGANNPFHADGGRRRCMTLQ